MLNKSIFNIEDTHKFQIDGTKILLDVNSGSVHVIDNLMWDFHDAIREKEGDLDQALAVLAGSYDLPIVDALKEEVLDLVDTGVLFSADEYRESYTPAKKPLLKSLCLNISHDCNLRCTYCFASSGHFGGQRLLMPENVGKRAIDYLIEHSGARKHCEIDFFGGEPLMNFDVVKSLVLYGRIQGQKYGKEIKFTLTTNGVDLNQGVQEFLNQENISVVLSLDGRPEVNDRVRKFPSGKGSYEIINSRIREFVQSRKGENYYVRGTYTGFNKDFCQDPPFPTRKCSIRRASASPSES